MHLLNFVKQLQTIVNNRITCKSLYIARDFLLEQMALGFSAAYIHC